MLPSSVCLLVATSIILTVGTVAGASPNFWPRYGGRRHVEVLDGQWKYGLNLDPNFDSTSAIFDPRKALTPNSTTVPSSMDAAPPGVPGPRGVAMYRRSFLQHGKVRLQFMGCSFYCRIFVDGKEVGEHRAGGFSPWFLDLDPPKQASGSQGRERELFVLADNRFNATTAPTHVGGDFWFYGGLVRSVILHDLPDSEDEIWVWRAHILPRQTEFGVVDINILFTDASFEGPVECELKFDDSKDSIAVKALVKKGSAQLRGLKVPNPRQWSLTDPQLHTLRVTVHGGSVTERFGLRSWGKDENLGRTTLNGQVVKLHGWNHHTQWIDTGASPTDEQLDKDMELLLKGNANYVRGAHYPQDQRWLDRLDEKGFAMWEETLGPNVKLENMEDWGHFMRYQLQQIDEMLEASMNHPSIMVWGFFNEGASNEKRACPAYEACAKRIAAKDSTRFTTYASNKFENDACLSTVSQISFNGYPGWYTDLMPGGPVDWWTREFEWIAKNYPKVPIFVSETGAGGIFEWKDNATSVKWGLKFQEKLIEVDVKLALENELVSGITLWHFFDFKGDDAAQKCGPCKYVPNVSPPLCSWYNMTGQCGWRPGGLNHKGVLDTYRRPKPSFYSVAALYGHEKSKTSSAPAFNEMVI
eukprot:TRINITY_DN22673_c0_g1_i1.p1 TRINITY_DN22673_c0_g1~~TRINITY_DN22673_c0_g1_i1.p1  ORF type:complete len:641 (-),score=102.98 TRINITY_DN22673_c0_g1_i1:275-2197(-)